MQAHVFLHVHVCVWFKWFPNVCFHRHFSQLPWLQTMTVTLLCNLSLTSSIPFRVRFLYHLLQHKMMSLFVLHCTTAPPRLTPCFLFLTISNSLQMRCEGSVNWIMLLAEGLVFFSRERSIENTCQSLETIIWQYVSMFTCSAAEGRNKILWYEFFLNIIHKPIHPAC